MTLIKKSKSLSVFIEKYLLILILFVAGFLRFFKLGVESLWNDELATWLFTTKTGLFQVIEAAGTDRSPPLYQCLIYLFTKFLGDSEWSLRLPSVVFSLLTVGAIYHLSKKFYSQQVAWLASFLFSILYMPIYFAQEARNYSLLILLSCLSFFFWMEILEFIKKRENTFTLMPFVFLALTSLLLCYTHYFGALLVVLQGLCLFLSTLSMRSFFHTTKIVITYCSVFILYLPWFSYLYPRAFSQEAFWIPKPNWESFVDIFRYFFNDSHLLGVIVFFFLLGFVLQRVLERVKEKKYLELISFQSFWQFLLITLFVLIVYVKSIYSTSVFQSKYFIVLAPLIYIHLARAIWLASSSRIIRSCLVVGFSFLFLFDLTYRIGYYSRDNKKEEFNKAFAIMSKYGNVARDWPVISHVWSPEYMGYYIKKFRLPVKEGFNIDGMDQDLTSTYEYLKSVKEKYPQGKGPDHFWFFSGHRIIDQYYLHQLSLIFPSQKMANLNGVRLILFKIPEQFPKLQPETKSAKK